MVSVYHADRICHQLDETKPLWTDRLILTTGLDLQTRTAYLTQRGVDLGFQWTIVPGETVASCAAGMHDARGDPAAPFSIDHAK